MHHELSEYSDAKCGYMLIQYFPNCAWYWKITRSALWRVITQISFPIFYRFFLIYCSSMLVFRYYISMAIFFFSGKATVTHCNQIKSYVFFNAHVKNKKQKNRKNNQPSTHKKKLLKKWVSTAAFNLHESQDLWFAAIKLSFINTHLWRFFQHVSTAVPQI